MSRVLVTGANGFIGKHVMAALAGSEHEVHAVVRDDSRVPGVASHVADLMDPQAVDEVMGAVRPELLLHLAWFTAPGRFWNSQENLKWVAATIRLAEAFAAHGGRRLVSAGTCAEYDLDFGFCSEAMTPTRPKTLYGASKLAVHSVLMAAAEEVGVEVTWGRIFHIYGPGEPEVKLVSAVIRSLLTGEVAACSTGEQFRDFIHVSDVASALVRLMDGSVKGPVNIGSGVPVRVAEVVRTIERLVGSTGCVRFGALPVGPDEPPVILADTRTLEAELGWSASISLEEGLAEMVRWWSARLADQLGSDRR